MKNDPIYVITTFEYARKNKNGLYEYGCTNSVGFYYDYNEAKHVVEKNVTDLWETCYDYAVIERISPGLYTMFDDDYMAEYYQFNPEKFEYEKMECFPFLDTHIEPLWSIA